MFASKQAIERTHRFVPPRAQAGRDKEHAKCTESSPGSTHFLQRQLGNGYVQSLAQPASDKETVTPRLRVKSFGVADRFEQDKSTGAFQDEQDQSASVTSYTTTARGVGMQVEAVGVYSSSDYPDGFRWTQTIDTNVPLGGTTSPYVDPRPNDDTKPFYWTDAEYAARPTTFRDFPSRNPPATGTTTWQAILSLNGVNGTDVTRFDSLTYGFSIDSTGTVTPSGLASPGSGLIATHQSTLASEFPGWTFA